MRAPQRGRSMDLNKRLDQVDEELGLLKNEIKQVLLEIQEQVLSIQDPFAALATSAASGQQVDTGAIADLDKRLVQVDGELKLLKNQLENQIATSSQAAVTPAPQNASTVAAPAPIPSAPNFIPAGIPPQYRPDTHESAPARTAAQGQPPQDGDTTIGRGRGA